MTEQFIFLDVYPLDYDAPATPTLDPPPWSAILATPEVRGVILKANDGVAYPARYAQWFIDNFKVVCSLLGDARGATALVGGYHYAQLGQSPEAQAERYVRALGYAGWDERDVMPVVDVEAPEGSDNARASATQVVDCVSAMVTRIKQLTGRRVMLYGRGVMRDLGIRSKMNCDAVWNPSATQQIELNGLTRVQGHPGPWSIEDVALWQYDADGAVDVRVTKLPTVVAGRARLDLSVFVDGDRRPTWDRALERLR